MRIGFDLDKVFIDTPPIIPDTVIDRLYKKKTPHELLYRMPSRPEQIVRRMSHQRYLRPTIKDNLAFLFSVDRKKHTLYLISSRFGFLEDITERLMKRLKLREIFTQIYFNYDNKQPHLYKNAIIKKLRLDRYVDDDLRLLEYVAERNKSTEFFWLNATKNNTMITSNIRAITSLRDVLETL